MQNPKRTRRLCRRRAPLLCEDAEMNIVEMADMRELARISSVNKDWQRRALSTANAHLADWRQKVPFDLEVGGVYKNAPFAHIAVAVARASWHEMRDRSAHVAMAGALRLYNLLLDGVDARVGTEDEDDSTVVLAAKISVHRAELEILTMATFSALSNPSPLSDWDTLYEPFGFLSNPSANVAGQKGIDIFAKIETIFADKKNRTLLEHTLRDAHAPAHAAAEFVVATRVAVRIVLQCASEDAFEWAQQKMTYALNICNERLRADGFNDAPEGLHGDDELERWILLRARTIVELSECFPMVETEGLYEETNWSMIKKMIFGGIRMFAGRPGRAAGLFALAQRVSQGIRSQALDIQYPGYLDLLYQAAYLAATTYKESLRTEEAGPAASGLHDNHIGCLHMAIHSLVLIDSSHFREALANGRLLPPDEEDIDDADLAVGFLHGADPDVQGRGRARAAEILEEHLGPDCDALFAGVYPMAAGPAVEQLLEATYWLVPDTRCVEGYTEDMFARVSFICDS